MPTEPILIGLCGGIGSGKSTVAGLFRKLGAGVIDADRIGHRRLKTPLIKRKLVRLYGKRILTGSGSINRRQLGLISFTRPGNLKRLNSLIHPFILKEIRKQIRKLAPKRLMVLDAALLLETGLVRECNYLIFVNAARHRRAERVAKQRGWAKQELHRRERFQMPLQRKKQQADLVINNISLIRTRQQVQRIFKKLTRSLSVTSQ